MSMTRLSLGDRFADWRADAPERRRLVYAAVAVCVVLGVGVVIGRSTTTAPGAVSAPAVKAPKAATLAPTTDHTQAGASAAAGDATQQLTASVLTEKPETLAELFVPDQRAQVTTAIAQAAATMTAQSAKQLRAVIAGFKVDSYTPQAAEIEVWKCLIAGVDRDATQAWQTSKLDMRWIDGRWLVAGSTEWAGPAPDAAPTPEGSTPYPVDALGQLGATTAP